MNDFLQSIIDRDPAAKSKLSLILTYPGVKAIFFYKIANFFAIAKFDLVARIISQFSRFLTGIEIHPRAKIGKNLFIDHGMGVVIGETSEIGNNVFIYQGVTLGGLATKKGKRHPTVFDDVVIGAGAKILGPIKIGCNTKIGSGSVVLQDVPEYSTVIGVPGRVVFSGISSEMEDDEEGPESFPDPVARAIECMLDRLPEMEKEIRQLKETLNENGIVLPDSSPIGEVPRKKING